MKNGAGVPQIAPVPGEAVPAGTLSRGGAPFHRNESSGDLKLSSMLAQSDMEIFLLDGDSLQFRVANPTALENTGYSLDEIQELHATDVQIGLDADQIAAGVALLRSGKAEVLPVEGLRRRKNGSVYPVDACLHLVDNDGVQHVVVTSIDVSQRMRAEERRRVVDETARGAAAPEMPGCLEHAMARMVDDVLAPIVASSQMVIERRDPGHPMRTNAERVLEAVASARRDVWQLLPLRDDRESEHGPVNLATTIERALGSLSRALPASVDVRVHAGEAPTVCGSAAQLQKMLSCLFESASRAFGSDTNLLEIRAEPFDVGSALRAAYPALREGPHARILIRHDGAGSEPTLLSRILGPAFTASGDRVAGLEHFVAREIVRSHHGVLSVESAPGVGATYAIYLPFDFSAVTSPDVEADRHVDPVRLRVVDPTGDVTRLVSRSLSRRRFMVERHRSCAEALTELRRAPDGCDALVVDEDLGDARPEELVAQALATRPDLPCIVMTSNGTTRREYAGVRCTISKPFTGIELAAVVREALLPASRPEPIDERVLALLSRREREVVLAFHRCPDAKQIAAQLCISPSTVRNHFKSIFRKLEVHSKVELLRRLGSA